MLDSCLRLIGPFGAPLRSRGWREHGSLALTEWNRKREEGVSHRASSVNATGKEPTTETALIFAWILVILTFANFVAAIAAGGVLVVTKPGAHAATWVAKSLHLISTRCPPVLSGCESKSRRSTTRCHRKAQVRRRGVDRRWGLCSGMSSLRMCERQAHGNEHSTGASPVRNSRLHAVILLFCKRQNYKIGN